MASSPPSSYHSDIDFDATTGLRFHPFEALLTTTVEIVLVIILGIPAVAVMLFTLIHIVTGLFTHLNIRLPSRLETALKLLVVTPNMHRIHHSARTDESMSNYGIVFSIWDRLFKTYKSEPMGGQEQMLFGLDNNRDPKRNMIIEFLILPFKPSL